MSSMCVPILKTFYFFMTAKLHATLCFIKKEKLIKIFFMLMQSEIEMIQLPTLN